MSKRPVILELRDRLRRTGTETVGKPLTRDEIERIIDQKLDQRLRHLRLALTPVQTRRGGCG